MCEPKELYKLAQSIDPFVALNLARKADTNEERNFYAFISDMNLQRAQREYIRNEHKLYQQPKEV